MREIIDTINVSKHLQRLVYNLHWMKVISFALFNRRAGSSGVFWYNCCERQTPLGQITFTHTGKFRSVGWDDIHISPDTSFYCDRNLAAGRFESITGWRPPAWNDMIAGLAHNWPIYAAFRGENS